MATVYFVGAGPGDPELLTVRADRLISGADTILYGGSLVPEGILERAGENAKIVDATKLSLEEVVRSMLQDVSEGKRVVRIHSGDPSIYSGVLEQIRELEKYRIKCEVVPGVSAWSAAAAILGQELTIRNLSRTVILTYRDDKTFVPERESLASLAGHHVTLVVFLEKGEVSQVADELMKHYRRDTPAVVVHKATWPEQKVLNGKLSEIGEQAEEEGIAGHALVIVGDVLDPLLRSMDLSGRVVEDK